MTSSPRRASLRAPLALLALLALLAACSGPSVQGVAAVEIVGGSRTVPQGGTALLTVVVTAGSGVETTVTWTSSQDGVATVAADGVLTAIGLGTTEVTATSTADATKSDTVTITVDVPDGTVRMTVNNIASAPEITGAGLLIAEGDALGAASAALIEIEEGVYIGPVASPDGDGGINMILPPVSDLPAALLAPASQLVANMDEFTDCELVPSRAGVSTTQQVPFFVPLPTAYAFAGSYFGITKVSDVQIDITTVTPEEFYASPFISWVYADSDVSVATSGAGCAGVLEVDLDLSAGWNQVAWTYHYDTGSSTVTSFSLHNDDTEELYLNLAPI